MFEGPTAAFYLPRREGPIGRDGKGGRQGKDGATNVSEPDVGTHGCQCLMLIADIICTFPPSCSELP